MHAEDFIDAAVASLRERLPARIEALNLAHDDFAIAAPADDGGALGTVAVGYSTGASPILSYPWVEVAAPGFLIDRGDLAQTEYDQRVDVIVRGLYQQALSATLLDRAVKRLGYCLLEVLLGRDAFGDGEPVESVWGRYRVNPETNDTEEIIGGVLLGFTIGSIINVP